MNKNPPDFHPAAKRGVMYWQTLFESELSSYSDAEAFGSSSAILTRGVFLSLDGYIICCGGIKIPPRFNLN